MIELVSTQRCSECNICVQVCPMNVFDRVPGQPPVIARQNDCQTCFMCEVYCPDDALYVSPDTGTVNAVDEHALAAADLLGSYRAAVGWSPRKQSARATDQTYLLLPPP